ncbi:MAG: mechanosensitive ion channel family protein [Bacilli bacterium]|jgi:small conductance mechanosensitive channel|nr:mechanosensitive ion channel family protein [Bacilli bacterium]
MLKRKRVTAEGGNPPRKLTARQITMIVVFSIVLALVILSVVIRLVADPASGLYLAVDGSIGKFFDIPNFFATKYLIILETFAIIVFMWALSLLSSLVIKLVTKATNRAQTIGLLIASIIRYSALIIAIFMVLSAWGVQTPTLLAGAGILGLAISLGAQTLIDDILSGLGLIFEKTFVVGDIVEIDGFRGKVLEIGIRVSKFENLAGDIRTINNADIRASINASDNWTPTLIDIGLGHEINLLEVEEKIKAFLPELVKLVPEIKVEPTYSGVEALNADGVTLRIVIYTHEKDKFSARRKVNRELKIYFDQVGIQVPYTEYLIKNVD